MLAAQGPLPASRGAQRVRVDAIPRGTRRGDLNSLIIGVSSRGRRARPPVRTVRARCAGAFVGWGVKACRRRRGRPIRGHADMRDSPNTKSPIPSFFSGCLPYKFDGNFGRTTGRRKLRAERAR
jgi:hypothetical protein